MYRNYKIVVNTAAGRRRYMQYLIPYIVSCPYVDRYDIWINTHNGADIEFFKQLACKFSVINLVWQPEGIVNGNASINAFYKDCVESNTIYFKLDDDIVWMEPGLIEKMIKFRIENPNHFLVSPLVINNSLSTYLLQLEGKLNLDQYYNADSSHLVLWKSGNFASELHSWFIENYLRKRKWDDLHCGKKVMAMTRFSINAILWFGDEMKKFSGCVPGDDEEFLSCIYPTKKGLSNAWNGDAIVAHFAFFTQREKLDKQCILEQYGGIVSEQWHSDMERAKVYDTIQNIMKDIQTEEKALINKESPYCKVVPTLGLKGKIKRYVPKVILELKSFWESRKDRNDYIKNK